MRARGLGMQTIRAILGADYCKSTVFTFDYFASAGSKLSKNSRHIFFSFELCSMLWGHQGDSWNSIILYPSK